MSFGFLIAFENTIRMSADGIRMSADALILFTHIFFLQKRTKRRWLSFGFSSYLCTHGTTRTTAPNQARTPFDDERPYLASHAQQGLDL